jgi:nucleotide-binding universal stress UspA family protein
MDYRKVLVSITGDEADAAAVQTAVKIAQPYYGVVRALYSLGESATVAQFRYPSLGDSFFTQIEHVASEARDMQEEKARAVFEDNVKHAWRELTGSVPDPRYIEWCAVDADMPDAIVYQGGIYDLLVLGEAGRNDPYVMEAALFHSGRPVLFAPAKVPTQIGNHVMIGWNRSAQAGKSVVNAIPLLQHAERVTICAVHTLARRGPSAEECAEYLTAHDIRADVVNVEPLGEAIGAILLDQAEQVGADVIVTGANYQSRLREISPGGVTGHLLRHATVAIMMSH